MTFGCRNRTRVSFWCVQTLLDNGIGSFITWRAEFGQDTDCEMAVQSEADFNSIVLCANRNFRRRAEGCFPEKNFPVVNDDTGLRFMDICSFHSSGALLMH